MEKAFELAGWCAAHAVLNLASQPASSEGAPGLVPFLVIEHEGKRAHVVIEPGPKAIADVDQVLDQLSPSERIAVLVQDAFITLDGVKSDCVIIDAHRLVSPRQSLKMAVPYQAPRDGKRFVLHRPKLIDQVNFTAGPADSAAFTRGIDSEPKAAAVWRAHVGSIP